MWVGKVALVAAVWLVASGAGAQARGLASTPVGGAGLTVDFYGALDLGAQGVAESTIGGAGHIDGDVNLKVAKGSSITYGSVFTGGRVLLLGGVRLAKGGDSVLISGMSVSMTSGVITAKVGGQAGVRVGEINSMAAVGAVKRAGSTVITLKLADGGISLDGDFAAAVNSELGTSLSTGTANGATLDIDVDLVRGHAPAADLLAVLGLDADLGLAELLALDVNTVVDLG
ncbi:hypothetical protein Aglo03_19530 [Actinokineospora globicatena]|uniref:Uncharacterized protein n=1 Tax=Actinokineospora globicatena TaxID=103729 RepID=A0A9W6QKC2_9PSEU|nr:hypothetical protein Aglo03_19530 [Actinokineospora globicatena]